MESLPGLCWEQWGVFFGGITTVIYHLGVAERWSGRMAGVQSRGLSHQTPVSGWVGATKVLWLTSGKDCGFSLNVNKHVLSEIRADFFLYWTRPQPFLTKCSQCLNVATESFIRLDSLQADTVLRENKMKHYTLLVNILLMCSVSLFCFALINTCS